jgi:ribonucleotide reductase, class II
MTRASYYDACRSKPVMHIQPGDRFVIAPTFLDQFRGKQPAFGPVGLITFKRTYARPLPDGTTEDYWQTVERIVNGIYTVQKWHCHHHNLPWSDSKAQRSAQIMYQLMWDFKFLPGGRGLWMMGTPYVEDRGSASLNNCSYVSSDSIETSFSEPFCFLMDFSMLGVGVGSDCKGAGKVIIQAPKQGDDIHVVEDTREGWVDLEGRILEAYVGKDTIPRDIDWSKIRPYGAPIKGFGGTSAGPEPLQRLVRETQRLLDRLVGLPITSEAIVDIFDMIGVCVVAGNVRRCLPSDTLVHTERGLVRIEDIKVGDMALTSGLKSNRFMPVTAKLDQGAQPLVEIKTQMGPFRCTPNERVAVLVGCGVYDWKRAEHLEIGDRLVFVEHEIGGSVTSLPAWSYDKPAHSTTCKDITIPALDERMAWFLGLFLGDGYTYANRAKDGFNAYISVAVGNDHTHDAIAERVRDAIARFGVNINEVDPSPDDNCRKIRSQSKQLAWYFDENFKQPNESLNVPECVLRGSDAIRAAFLAGLLDADGSIGNRPTLLCASVYPKFLEQVQTVYASLGIPTRIKTNRPEKGNWQALYHLVLVGKDVKPRFQNTIMAYSVKSLPEARWESQFDYGYPTEWIKESLDYAAWKGKWTPTNKQMTVATFKECGGDSKGLVPIAVLDVTEVPGEHQTYDIEVSGAEEFVANGLLVHNSAIIMFGEGDDESFLNLKNPTLNKEAMNGWRWAANNSIFAKVGMDYTRTAAITQKAGEPGFMWLDNAKKYGRMGELADDSRVAGFNPCQPAWAPVLTQSGIRTIGDIDAGAVVWSGKQWTRVTKKWSTGIKPVIAYKTRAGTFYGTENHRVVQDGEKIEVKDAEGIDIAPMNPEFIELIEDIDTRDVMDGLVLGDGTVHKASNDLVLLIVGENDKDYFSSEVAPHLIKHRPGVKDGYWDIDTTIRATELPKTYERKIPDRFKRGSVAKVRGFLRGLFSANGSVVGNSVRLKASSPSVIEDAQQMLSSIGIRSFYTINKEHDCKESYDLNIGPDRQLFRDSVGFIQDYKTKKLDIICDRPGKRPKTTFEITERVALGEHEVFDITVEAEEHTYWTGGLLVSNCAEISLESYELCVGGRTKIQLESGVTPIENLVGNSIKVWNGDGWSVVKPRVTGHNRELYRVTLSDGSFLDCTSNHGWHVKQLKKSTYCRVETGDLGVGDKVIGFKLGPIVGQQEANAYEMGFYVGDGYIDRHAMVNVCGKKLGLRDSHQIEGNWYKEQHPDGYADPIARLSLAAIIDDDSAKTLLDKGGLSELVFGFDRQSALNFIGGYIDADGTITNHGGAAEGYRVYGSEWQMRDFQLLLRRVNIDHSTVCLFAKAGEETNYGKRSYDLWYCQIPSFECSEIPTRVRQATPAYKDSRPIDSALKQRVVSVVKLPGLHTTYCFDEPEKHMAVFGNVITYQCNLAELFPSRHASYEEFERTIKFAYLYAKTVSLIPTHNSKTNAVMLRNRRIGLSQSGIVQSFTRHGRRAHLEWCDRGYAYVTRLDKMYSEWLCVRKSIKKTTVKPAGTTSLLPGVTPGIHYEHASHYFRTIRVAKTSPIVEQHKRAGYRVEDDVYDKGGNTAVIYFPIKAKFFDRAKDEVSMWEQLENAAQMQKHWSDNSVSCTITFKPSEAKDISRALELYETRMKTVSFLPLEDHGYKQAPYITLTEAEYEEAVAAIVAADLSKAGHDDESTPRYCDGDRCVVPTKKAVVTP